MDPSERLLWDAIKELRERVEAVEAFLQLSRPVEFNDAALGLDPPNGP